MSYRNPKILTRSAKWSALKQYFVAFNSTSRKPYLIIPNILKSTVPGKLLLIFSTNPCVFYIARRFGWRLQPISWQFVNLINHNTVQWYSRWNTSNRMLSEEKSKGNWSILMPSQDTTLLLYPVMRKFGYPVSAYSNIF